MPVPFNESKLDEYAAPPSAARGQHCGLVVDAQVHDSQNNDNLMGVLYLRKLKDADDPNSVVGPKVRNYFTLPLDNPNVEGHEVPDWAPRMFVPFAQAFTDDVPSMPIYDRDSRTFMLNGEVLETKGEVKAAKMEALRAAGLWGSELWGENGEGISRLVGSVVYYEIDYEDGSDLPSVKSMHGECPDDWELTDKVTERIATDDEEEKKTPRSRGKKKASKKKKARSRRR